MNAYVEMQMGLVAARQSALRAEADTIRLLATASPLPVVSASSRAADRNRSLERTATSGRARSLGAAAADATGAVSEPVSACDCSHGAVAA
jgi:hypothetical protein